MVLKIMLQFKNIMPMKRTGIICEAKYKLQINYTFGDLEFLKYIVMIHMYLYYAKILTLNTTIII